VARTFLYLAYADQLQLTLTPDVQRNDLLTHLADQEGIFRGMVLQKIQKKYDKSFQGYGDQKLQGKVSPCAAIVFERAGGMKRNIPYEMIRLRKELTSTRETLHGLEQDILSQHDQAKAQAAFNKWNDALVALEETYLSPSFRYASAGRKLQTSLSMAPLATDVIAIGAQPNDPTKWTQAFLDLPFDKLKLFLGRRTLLDLYHVLQPPSLLRLRPLLVQLFGESILW
jgi:hypothetical protein